jgi:hypothetical protein
MFVRLLCDLFARRLPNEIDLRGRVLMSDANQRLQSNQDARLEALAMTKRTTAHEALLVSSAQGMLAPQERPDPAVRLRRSDARWR